jgi:hypothetical protein
MSFRLSRTKQCKNCPWKVTTNPFDIPDGYDVEKHKALEDTIATPGSLDFRTEVRVMACHHSTGDDEMFCVGWLHNQLGSGNNIGLRLRFFSCENLNKLTVVGEQHETFADTLPENA